LQLAHKGGELGDLLRELCLGAGVALEVNVVVAVQEQRRQAVDVALQLRLRRLVQVVDLRAARRG
jgi:hypothetical protein